MSSSTHLWEMEDIALPNFLITLALSVTAGLLLSLFGIPIRIITGTTVFRKKTLWEFENIWLFISIALFFYPIATIFVIVPFDALYDAFTQSFDPIEWIIPVIVAAVWVIVGFTSYAFAVNNVGLAIATTITFAVNTVISTMGKFVYYGNYGSILQVCLASAGLGALLIAVFIYILASIFIERSTRSSKKELEDHILSDIARQRMKQKSSDQVKVKNKSKSSIVAMFFLGLVSAVISGICYSLLQISTILSRSIIDKFTNHMNIFQAKVIILAGSLSVGSIAALLLSIVFLVSRLTIKKYALCSGGLIACDKCTNFKVLRLVSVLFTIIMSILWYGSFIALIYAEFFLETPSGEGRLNLAVVSNFHYVIFAAVTIICSNILSLPLCEYQNTGPTEKVLIPFGLVFIVFGFCLVTAGTFRFSIQI